VNVVVPNQSDDDWTTDVLAVWPDDQYDSYYNNPRYVRVDCGNGRFELLPLELALWGGCRRQGVGTGVASIPSDGTHQPGDTTLVHAPGRRRPEPAPGPGEAAEGSTRRSVPQRRPEPRAGVPEVVEPATTQPRVAPERGGTGEDAPAKPRVERPITTQPETTPEPAAEPRSRPARIEPRETPAEPRESPRSQPTRAEPRETPRSEPVRSQPRETPRSEPVRSEPRSETPRSEPVRSEPARSEPAPSSRPVAPSPPPRAD
jgi:hypothetical protein